LRFGLRKTGPAGNWEVLVQGELAGVDVPAAVIAHVDDQAVLR
jgi:hypothetical protein